MPGAAGGARSLTPLVRATPCMQCGQHAAANHLQVSPDARPPRRSSEPRHAAGIPCAGSNGGHAAYCLCRGITAEPLLTAIAPTRSSCPGALQGRGYAEDPLSKYDDLFEACEGAPFPDDKNFVFGAYSRCGCGAGCGMREHGVAQTLCRHRGLACCSPCRAPPPPPCCEVQPCVLSWRAAVPTGFGLQVGPEAGAGPLGPAGPGSPAPGPRRLRATLRVCGCQPLRNGG